VKRQIEICASFTGTIPTGNFENSKPFYSVKEIIDVGEDALFDDNNIIGRQEQLHKICYDQFKQQAEVSYQERIAKQYKDIRWYDGANGLKYPSVTSITSLDKDFKVPPDELVQYSARGTCIHKQVELFLKTGEWTEIKDIAEVSTEYVTVCNGSLGLALDDTDFRSFYKAYPFKVLEVEKTVINDHYRYGGRLDILCVIESENKGKWEKIDGVKYDEPTILDIKTGATLDKVSGLTQQAAYSVVDAIKQIGLIHLNKDVKQGFSAPTITTNIPRYWDLFYKKLQVFNGRYGI